MKRPNDGLGQKPLDGRHATPGARRSSSAIEREGDCPECGSDHIIRDEVRGELLCAECGLILSENAIDERPEWSAYSPEDEERLARTGPPKRPLTGAAGLTTLISYSTRDGRGNPIYERNWPLVQRLRNLQRISAHVLPGERSLPEAVRLLRQIASQMELPPYVEAEASLICKRALEAKLASGRAIQSIVAAALYAACRIEGVPRTLAEVGLVAGIPKKSVARVYRVLLRAHVMPAVPPTQPSDYLDRFCSELALSSGTRAKAMVFLQDLARIDSAGTSAPSGNVAAALLIACRATGERRSEKAIAHVTGVSEVTIRNRVRFLMQRVLSLSAVSTLQG